MSDPAPETAELTYTRVFDAPRELVFRCMTEPEHLAHFWGPAGTHTPPAGIRADARPGGVFETVMVSDADGSQYTMRAVYVEVVPPERLVWTEPGTGVTTTSTFTDLGGSRTEVRIQQRNVPSAFRAPGAQAGFRSSLDRFAAYLATLLPATYRPPGNTPLPATRLRSIPMDTVSSADGTTIAYERQGQGPALILVDGALCARGSKAGLADQLAADFTVYRYDRRGRGDSGDTQPYAVEREIEDLTAVIGAAGGVAFLYGHSSGCALVMDTVLQAGETAVPKIALYEAPYDDDPAAQGRWEAYLGDLTAALAAGRRGDAVARFMSHVGTPAEQITAMRQAPFFAGLEAVAPTLAYDHAGLLGDRAGVPVAKAAHITVPTLVMYGDASFPFMRETAGTLGKEIPHSRLRAVDGQTHDVDPAVLAPVLADFFAG